MLICSNIHAMYSADAVFQYCRTWLVEAGIQHSAKEIWWQLYAENILRGKSQALYSALCSIFRLYLVRRQNGHLFRKNFSVILEWRNEQLCWLKTTTKKKRRKSKKIAYIFIFFVWFIFWNSWLETLKYL